MLACTGSTCEQTSTPAVGFSACSHLWSQTSRWESSLIISTPTNGLSSTSSCWVCWKTISTRYRARRISTSYWGRSKLSSKKKNLKSRVNPTLIRSTRTKQHRQQVRTTSRDKIRATIWKRAGTTTKMSRLKRGSQHLLTNKIVTGSRQPCRTFCRHFRIRREQKCWGYRSQITG